MPTACLVTGGWLDRSHAKTAHGLLRGPSRFRIVAVVDPACAGRDAGEVLDGVPRGIPVVADLDALDAALPARPDWAVVGVATSGGVLPAALRAVLLGALQRGIGVVNGLHEVLGEDPELASAATQSGARIVDLRRPRPRAELAFWSGAIRGVRTPRVAVLGTDCALGKRTTCQLLVAELGARGVAAAMVYTGQTGWLQGVEHGFVLDATPNDFVSGELERAIVACDRDLAPDVILLEGQSALRNPSGPCGAELLLSGGARHVVLQHAPGRRWFDDQEALENEIPPVDEEVRLIALYGARVVALALNHEGLAEGDLERARAEVERATGLPAAYALREGVGRLAGALLEALGPRGRA